MKIKMALLGLALAFVLAQGSALAGVIDDTIKWSQPYDPNYEYAVDVPSWSDVANPFDLFLHQAAADDWLCTTPLPVTDIHWWGSYLGSDSETPPNSPVHFAFHIWTDVPADVNGDYSHPGELLWSYGTEVYEEVYTGFHDANGDAVFQYNIDIDPANWFYQDPNDGLLERPPGAPDGNVYWLMIIAGMTPPEDYPHVVGENPVINGVFHPWGWASRPHYFNDDAVVGLYTGTWAYEPLIDGDQNSMDLAFELTTVPEPTTLIILASGVLALAGVLRKRLS